MSIRLRDVLMRELGVLRHEPIDKRIRATLGGETVVDSTRAMLVWEPLRVVPTYAVPEEDVRAEIAAAAGKAGAEGMGDAPQLAGRRVLDPSVPFAVRRRPAGARSERPVRGAQHGGRGARGAGRRPRGRGVPGRRP